MKHGKHGTGARFGNLKAGPFPPLASAPVGGGRVRLTPEQELATQVLQARAALTARGQLIAHQAKRIAELEEQVLLLTSAQQDVDNRALATRYGFPEGAFTVHREPDGLYIDVVGAAPPTPAAIAPSPLPEPAPTNGAAGP